MANQNRYYRTPFAESGNKAEVPNVSVGGAVAYDTGFGPDYELPQGTVNRKRIERDLYNGMHNGITKNLKQWQENLYPTWIEDDGTGAAFAYDEGMIVNHDGDNWISNEAANQEEPGSGSKWAAYLPSKNTLQGLSGLTSPSDLAQRHRIETTVAEIATGVFKVGALLEVADRGGAAFNVEIGAANGYNQINAGGGNVAVLQRNENNSYTPTAFGFPQGGATDSYSAWLAYLASGLTYFDWDNGTYALSDFVQINTGTTHNFAGTKLKALGANKVLRAGFADDWAITGNLTLLGTGDGSGEATEDATILFELEDNKRWLVENVTCLDSLGKAFYFKGDSASRAEKGRMNNCYSYRCQKGWDMEANGSTEYNTFSNCGAVSNFIGVKTGAGNIRWIGGVITDNARNVELVAGDNHLHGKMIGVAINHATSENLLATDISLGFGFVGCDFYGDDANAGRITLNNSQGISISNGLLDCRVQIEAGLGTITGENKIINMTIAGTNASYQGDLSRLVSHGHTGIAGIDAKAFNRIQPLAIALNGDWSGSLSLIYSPSSNEVSLEGSVSGGTAVNIATIPEGFRPSRTIQLAIDASGGYGAVSINHTTGEVRFEVGPNSAVRLDSCRWQAWQ